MGFQRQQNDDCEIETEDENEQRNGRFQGRDKAIIVLRARPPGEARELTEEHFGQHVAKQQSRDYKAEAEKQFADCKVAKENLVGEQPLQVAGVGRRGRHRGRNG